MSDEYAQPAGLTQDASHDCEALTECVRVAHKAICGAAENILQEANVAGVALAQLKKLVGHGEWSPYLRRHCDLSERQAERYMQLARLIKANPSRRTDLAGMGIQAAIKALSPPARKKTTTDASGKDQNSAKHWLAVWRRMSPEEQQHAVGVIGMAGWLAAMPTAWLPELERRLDRQPTAAAKSTTDVLLGKALRHALSLQKTATNRDNTSASVAAALNAILNKLRVADLHLNDVDVVVRAPVRRARAA